MIQVVKIGGNIVDNPEALDAFCQAFARMEGPKVLVHGGGVMASHIQESLGLKPIMVEGRRVTDRKTLSVVTMVYAGYCNKTIVALLQKYGCNALGLAGCDGGVIRARRRGPKTLSDGFTKMDFGFVGDVSPTSFNIPFIRDMLAGAIVPVFCPINHDGQGHLPHQPRRPGAALQHQRRHHRRQPGGRPLRRSGLLLREKRRPLRQGRRQLRHPGPRQTDIRTVSPGGAHRQRHGPEAGQCFRGHAERSVPRGHQARTRPAG